MLPDNVPNLPDDVPDTVENRKIAAVFANRKDGIPFWQNRDGTLHKSVGPKLVEVLNFEPIIEAIRDYVLKHSHAAIPDEQDDLNEV